MDKFVARCFGVYAGPTTSGEDRFIEALERRFPSSEWIELEPEVEPQPASTQSSRDDGIPAPADVGGAGALPPFDYAVVGTGKVAGPTLEAWLRKVPKRARIICGQAKFTKKGAPRNTEALLVTLRPNTIALTLREDLYGTYAEPAMIGQVLSSAQNIVLIGGGGRIDIAHKWLRVMTKTQCYFNSRLWAATKIPQKVLELET